MVGWFIIIKYSDTGYGQLAQLAEQRTLNPWVQGSIPWLPIRGLQVTIIGGLFLFQNTSAKKNKLI